jgi:hypothetical protein
MSESEKWDAILTLGAAIAEEALLRVKRFDKPTTDDLYVLSSAVAWAALRRFWDGEKSEVLGRWHKDIPDAMSRYAGRMDGERPL